MNTLKTIRSPARLFRPQYSRLAGLMLAGFMGFPAMSQAAESQEQVKQELQGLREQTQRIMQRIQQLEHELATSEPPVLPVAGPGQIVPRSFSYVGNTVFSSKVLDKLTSQYIGKATDFDGLSDVADAIKDYYHKRGYFLAVAFLPKQDVTDGVVTIQVLEGRIGKIKLTQSDPKGMRVRESQVAGMVNTALKPGDLITENKIERPLLLLRDLPGVQMQSTINHGEEPGTADIDLVAEPDPTARRITSNIQVDNYGNRFTGQNRLGLNSSINGLTGIGDVLNFQGFTTGQGTFFGDVGYQAPVGNYGTHLGVNYGHMNYLLGKDFTQLQAQGTADIADVYLAHPIYRAKDKNMFAQVGYENKKLVDSQLGLPDSPKNIDAIKFQLNGDWRGTGNVNVYTVDMMLANLTINDAQMLAADQSTSGYNTAGHFSKLNFDYQRLQQIVPNWALFLSTSGQLADRNLTSAEKFVLGGPDHVRGYPVGEGEGDQGIVATTELRYSVPKFHVGLGTLVVSAFYDYGRIQYNQNLSQAPVSLQSLPNGRELSSYGFAFNLGHVDDYLFRTIFAWHGASAPTSDSVDPTTRIWLEVIKWF